MKRQKHKGVSGNIGKDETLLKQAEIVHFAVSVFSCGPGVKQQDGMCWADSK